jgi:ABC-type multidrug transport system ATPase subunit
MAGKWRIWRIYGGKVIASLEVETDKIVVLENGRIAETDSPEELKKQNGIFARMVEKQMGKEYMPLND